MKFRDYIIIIVGLIIIFFIVRSCEKDPIVKTKTEIVYVPKIDTIIQTIIDTVPKKVYVERWKTIKGKDTIIYRYTPNDSTINANQYRTEIVTDSSRADLLITTTGKLIDVQGTISYDQKQTTITNDIIKPMSGLFIYGETSVLPTFQRAELGLDYQFRNQIIIGTSASYENISKQLYVNAKIGMRIF